MEPPDWLTTPLHVTVTAEREVWEETYDFSASSIMTMVRLRRGDEGYESPDDDDDDTPPMVIHRYRLVVRGMLNYKHTDRRTPIPEEGREECEMTVVFASMEGEPAGWDNSSVFEFNSNHGSGGFKLKRDSNYWETGCEPHAEEMTVMVNGKKYAKKADRS